MKCVYWVAFKKYRNARVSRYFVNLLYFLFGRGASDCHCLQVFIGKTMSAVEICALFVTAILLKCADAHSHSDTDLSFDKIPVVAQKYPSLADVDIDPGFLAEHRRKLVSVEQNEAIIEQTCDPQCVKNANAQWLSCDDLVCTLCVAVAVVI